MAKRPLKVFRTSAGFQDAYVAATSRKAALAAWGARSNLFASGIAEEVTDPEYGSAALAEPGKVIRAPRGTAAEHLAAAAKGKKAPGAPAQRPTPRTGKDETPAQKRKPRPSRAKLAKAEADIAKLENGLARKLSAIDARIDRLRNEREQLRKERDRALSLLEDRREREGKAYRAAMAQWQA